MAPIVLAIACLTTALPASAVAGKLPSAPLDLKVTSTLTGVGLAWTPAADANDDAITGYVIHRLADGVDTALPWTEPWNSSIGYKWYAWEHVPGATYSVAATNAEGEGAASTPVALPITHQSITVAHGVWTGPTSSRTYIGQLPMPNPQLVVPLASDGPTQYPVDGYVAASPDGREVAFPKGQAAIWRVRADVPGATPVKILDGSTGIVRLAWSPDGSKIAYERLQPDSYSCVEIVAATGGTPVQVGCHLAMPTWTPDGAELIVKEQFSGVLERIEAKAAGAVRQTFAGTQSGTQPSVSPDGRWIGYAAGNAPAVLPIGGGTPKLGAASGLSINHLSWSPDGSSLLVTRPITYGGGIIVSASVGADGTVGADETVYRSEDTGWIASAEYQGPRVVIPALSAVMGQTVRVPFDASGLPGPATTTCQLDNGPYEPCASPYVKAGVPTGSHHFRVKAVDADGHASVAYHAVMVDATAPSVRITAPVFDVTTAATAAVTYAATDNSGVAVSSYDARWRIAPAAGNFGAYATLKSGTPATSVQIGLVPGYEYCVSVRARDAVGNLSGWTADRCFSRPSDDRAMSMSRGWTRASNRLYYLGTATVTKATNIDVARSSVQAKRLWVVATVCTTCGTLTVYYNGKSVGKVDLTHPRTIYQAIVPLPAPATFLTGSVLLRTSIAGKVYQIDGLAVRRT
ncbi:hypothetical protein ACQHIV_34870 [Kribbella sp. GL6]|uniref:hypothetical protein n=1 Tax=Kribbella sp. GL6 TaxID=3419765 RepID=UPI003D086782